MYRTIKKSAILMIEHGKTFCMQTSIHGFNHIVAPRRHWIERLLWVVVTAIAVLGVVDISLGQWQRYIENPTVVTLEKDFRSWRFSMPAVTACEEERVSPKKLAKAIKSRWNLEPEDEKYEYYSKFVHTVANADLFHLEGYQDFKNDGSLNVDLYELIVEVAPELSVKIGSSDSSSAKWMLAMTEKGVCYVINSVAIADVAIQKNDTQISPFSCVYSSQSCFFMFESSSTVDYYIHSPYEVVDVTSPPSRTYPSLNRFTELSASETLAGPGVRQLPPRTRHCLYTDEPTQPHRQVYSTNTCRLACRSRLAIQLCGCKPFYYFYEEGPTCNVSGMWCLSTHAQRLLNFNGEKCPCSQQCVDAVFREITTEDQLWERGPFAWRGAVRFTVQAPRTRYTRYIVFHFQDLVVSFGGAAGLFLGASFISFVEIVYFILERIFASGTARSTSTIEKTKKTKVPYENRIRELTSMLEERYYNDQSRFGYNVK